MGRDWGNDQLFLLHCTLPYLQNIIKIWVIEKASHQKLVDCTQVLKSPFSFKSKIHGLQLINVGVWFNFCWQQGDIQEMVKTTSCFGFDHKLGILSQKERPNSLQFLRPSSIQECTGCQTLQTFNKSERIQELATIVGLFSCDCRLYFHTWDCYFTLLLTMNYVV